MKRIGVVSSSRADYSCYQPLLRRLADHKEFELELFATGMHLSGEHGMTVQEIEKDGYRIVARIPTLAGTDDPAGVALAIGQGVSGFSAAFARARPDLLLVFGDRFDMIPAALAALPFLIPIVHLHGGEITEGAIDDSIRHCLTKLSHFHFVATEAYRARVLQLGEEPWRVVVTGALSIDNVLEVPRLSPADFKREYGVSREDQFLLVTFHPVTREYTLTAQHVQELLAALTRCNRPILFTSPNADTHGKIIADALADYVTKNKSARLVPNLGTRAYLTAMAEAAAMVGNSSSGLIEAASFSLPVVNVGNRQAGRFSGDNVIHVPCERDAIFHGVEQALSGGFRQRTSGMTNPYGDGQAAARMIHALENLPDADKLLHKRFHDLEG